MQELFKKYFKIILVLFQNICLLCVMNKEKKRYEVTKYGFSQMAVGDEKDIEVSGIGTYHVYTNLKAACRAESTRHGSTWVTRRTDTHVYYKRTS